MYLYMVYIYTYPKHIALQIRKLLCTVFNHTFQIELKNHYTYMYMCTNINWKKAMEVLFIWANIFYNQS